MLGESKKVQRKSKPNQSQQANEILNNINISIINDVTNYNKNFNDKTLKTSVKSILEDVDLNKSQCHIYTHSATLFFKNPHIIMIPSKVKTLIERELPKHLLDRIHGRGKTEKNRQVAVELCLLLLSQLSATHRNILNGESPDGWKSLRAEYLRELLWVDAKTYQRVTKVLLEFKYQVGTILERTEYKKGVHSYKYRLAQSFCSKGFIAYKLQTDLVKELFKKSCDRKFKEAQKNIICINLIEFYKTLVLPSEDEIHEEADRLIKSGYVKNGKKLKRRNKKSDAKHGDISKLSFVEDSLKIYNYLTNNGLLIPKRGNEKSGGRIVDSFTLMPSWIRKLIKIRESGQPIAEADYSCLHPNIAMTLYSGNEKFLKHIDLAVKLDIDIEVVKNEHLSFFNKKIWQMENSPLFNYYKEYDSVMFNNFISEKKISEYGHKITSRRLFAKEVEIMTEVIKRLNEEGIFVGYIYDALFFDPQYSEKVVETMNEVVVELGVYTTAKLQ